MNHAMTKSNKTSMPLTNSQQSRRTFMPRANIYESASEYTIVADMPGVNDSGIDVSLDKDILTIRGSVKPFANADDGVELVYSEYEEGDYFRSFTLSKSVDAEHIEASIKNGVLRVKLPKADSAKPHRITVKAE